MRYLTIIVSLFILSTQFVAGQSVAVSPGKFYMGFMAGVNATAIVYQNNYGQTEMDYKVPLGFAAGASMQYRFTPKSHLAIEVNYLQMGQKHDDHIKKMHFYKDINLSYLVIPILYKLVLNKTSVGYEAAIQSARPKWYLLGGFQPSFLISANNRYEIDGNQTDFISFITAGGNPNLEQILINGEPENDTELYKNVDIAFVGAAGFHKQIQPSVVGFVEVRGSIGLLDINSEKWQLPGASGTYNWSRNLSFGLYAGITFKIF